MGFTPDDSVLVAHDTETREIDLPSRQAPSPSLVIQLPSAAPGLRTQPPQNFQPILADK